MTFLIGFPSIFNRIIGWNILSELYKVLLGLGMMINNDILKYNSQYSKLIYTLVMLTKFFKHVLSLMITLRCFQNILSRLGIDKLLQLAIELSNFLLENKAYIIAGLVEILFNMLELICWLCVYHKWATYWLWCLNLIVFQRFSIRR